MHCTVKDPVNHSLTARLVFSNRLDAQDACEKLKSVSRLMRPQNSILILPTLQRSHRGRSSALGHHRQPHHPLPPHRIHQPTRRTGRRSPPASLQLQLQQNRSDRSSKRPSSTSSRSSRRTSTRWSAGATESSARRSETTAKCSLPTCSSARCFARADTSSAPFWTEVSLCALLGVAIRADEPIFERTMYADEVEPFDPKTFVAREPRENNDISMDMDVEILTPRERTFVNPTPSLLDRFGGNGGRGGAQAGRGRGAVRGRGGRGGGGGGVPQAPRALTLAERMNGPKSAPAKAMSLLDRLK